jgi:Flp pilus assembly protein TadG
MKNTNRSQRGVSGLVIVLATAFMIILPLGFLGYEYMRYTMVQQELRAVTDAAALAGAVGIATNGGIGSNTLWAQDASAMAAAYDTFCENSLSGTPLLAIGFSSANVNASESSSTSQPAHFNNSAPWTNVAPNTAQVNFVLLDANGNQTNWSSGGGPSQSGLTSATSLRVDAYYGYSLPILGGLNIGPFTMNASSAGGLPQLDVILCFDISGSMDDFTNITFINRFWVDTRTNPAGLSIADLAALNLPTDGSFQGGCVEYDIPSSAGSFGANPPFWSTPADGSASGPLYYVTGCDKQPTSSNGTSLNVQPPMNLNQGPSGPIQFYFMSQQRNSGQGLPPGNFAAVGIPGLPIVITAMLPLPIQIWWLI